jgi:DnaJ-class molecular chaperone
MPCPICGSAIYLATGGCGNCHNNSREDGAKFLNEIKKKTETCPDCGGYGEVPYMSAEMDASWELCERCKGSGELEEKEEEE